MAKRPSLSEDSFLKHLFSPRKNPMPTGLRKRDLVFSKGRDRKRVNAYNRMSAVNREILTRSGQRESYLRGQTTLPQARSALRETAVGKGLAKPLRSRQKATQVPTGSSLDVAVTANVVTQLRNSGATVSVDRVAAGVPRMRQADKPRMRRANASQIRAYASDPANNVIINGKSVNPLWYHYSA